MSDEWVTQMLRQGDAQVMKKYSQMKRKALEKLNPGGRNCSGTCGTNVHGRGPMSDFDRINAR